MSNAKKKLFLLQNPTITMASLKTFLKPQHLFYTLLKHHKPSSSIYTQHSHHPYIISQFHTNADLLQESDSDNNNKESSSSSLQFNTNLNDNKKKIKSLDLIFKSAVGLTDEIDSEIESDTEDNLIMKKLKKLETEIRIMKGIPKVKMSSEKKPKKVELVQPSLSSLFSQSKFVVSKEECGDSSKKEEGVSKEIKEFSSEMKEFVKVLHEKGYFKDANFLRFGQLDFGRFSTDYARGYLVKAAVKFSKDHPEIAACLSENDVKRLALFGCPSDEKKPIFAAKGLRSHFSIQEDMVCRPCVLSDSCKFKFSYIGMRHNEYFANVMKTLISYALESGPPQLVLSEEVKVSIRNLLRQIVSQS